MWPDLFLAQEATDITSPKSGINWADVIDSLARTPLSKVVIFVAICTAIRLAVAPYLAKTVPHKRSGMYTFAKYVNEALDAVVYAGVFVFLLIRPFCIQAFKIPSGSMLDTLQIDDFIVANKAIYRYSEPVDGDIVVFRPPKIAATKDQLDKDGEVNVDFIKRLIGSPGDVIEIKDGTLYRNGKPVIEKYIKDKPDYDFKIVNDNGTYKPLSISGESVNADNHTADFYRLNDFKSMDRLRKLPPAPIPKGMYLFMGDNRLNSFDGRAWGLVPREDIIGRSEFIWLPFSRWRITR